MQIAKFRVWLICQCLQYVKCFCTFYCNLYCQVSIKNVLHEQTYYKCCPCSVNFLRFNYNGNTKQKDDTMTLHLGYDLSNILQFIVLVLPDQYIQAPLYLDP